MPFVKKWSPVIAGLVLAGLEAANQLSSIGAYHNYASMAILVLGVVGVALMPPSKVIGALRLPPQVIAAITSGLGALEVVQHTSIGMPKLIHAAIGFVIVLAGTLGFQVSPIIMASTVMETPPKVH